MDCKICGGKLDPKYPACPYCGTLLSTEECLALTGKEKILEEDEKAKKKQRNFLISVVVIIVSIAILSTGFYHVLSKQLNPEKPEISFNSGYGIINGNEPVVYVEIGQNAQLEYIHGAKLYAYDKSNDGVIGDALTSDYEYTKSEDGTFRTIFFNADDFDLKADEEYTYTFEMSFSFVDKKKIFVYQKAVSFPGTISGDVSDVIFDHSMEKTTQPIVEEEKTTKPVVTETTTHSESTTKADTSFIYSSFWFMTPHNEGDRYNISSIKFERNGKCAFTNFYKKGAEKWKITNTRGTYEVDGSTLLVTDSEGMVESYVIDSASKNLNGLESRKYNSTKNAEDFFGI